MKHENVLTLAINSHLNMFDVDRTNGLEVVGGIEDGLTRMMSQALRTNLVYVERNEDNITDRDLEPNDLFPYNSDIAVGRLGLTEEYAKIASPSAPYDFGEVRFIISPPTLASKAEVIIYPFRMHVWMAIIVILFLMPIILRYLYRNPAHITDLFFGVFSNLLQKQSKIKISPTFRDRSLCVCWHFGALVIALSYTSTVLSFLMLPRRHPSLDTLPKLSRAVGSGSYKCAVLEGAGILVFMTGQENVNVKRLGDKILSNGWQIKYSSQNVLKAINDNFAVIMPYILIQSLPSDRIILSRDSIYSASVVMFCRKDFCCREKLDRSILRMTAAGLYAKSLDHYFFKKQLRNEMATVENSMSGVRALTLHDVMGAFTSLVIGWLMSIVVFLVEVLYKSSFNCMLQHSCKTLHQLSWRRDTIYRF
nr:uncharacterized protein LOC110281998 [Parasteatoda tepidariorum]